MKSDKKLLEIFNKCNKDIYYSFDNFKTDIKSYKEFFTKKNKGRIILSCRASRSGMSRKMNFYPKFINVLVNITHKEKISWDEIMIYGCGMDMVWNTLFTTASYFFTRKEMYKWSVNSKCSSYIIL